MSLIRLADAHAHLDMPEYAADQAEIIAAAGKAGIALIINVGISLENSYKAMATAQKSQHLCGRGSHAHGAAGVSEAAVADIAELLHKPRVVAVGEIGLDFYRNRAPADVQERVFRRFLDLAVRRHKPVIIHSRDATRKNLVYSAGLPAKAPWRGNALFQRHV